LARLNLEYLGKSTNVGLVFFFFFFEDGQNVRVGIDMGDIENRVL